MCGEVGGRRGADVAIRMCVVLHCAMAFWWGSSLGALSLLFECEVPQPAAPISITPHSCHVVVVHTPDASLVFFGKTDLLLNPCSCTASYTAVPHHHTHTGGTCGTPNVPTAGFQAFDCSTLALLRKIGHDFASRTSFSGDVHHRVHEPAIWSMRWKRGDAKPTVLPCG